MFFSSRPCVLPVTRIHARHLMETPIKHFVRRKPADAKRSLKKAIRSGGVTLVLGAGVSMGRGVPSWTELVRKLWMRLCSDQDVPDWLQGGVPPPHPFAHQIVMEEIEGALRWQMAREGGAGAVAVRGSEVQARLVRLIGECLYADERAGGETDTLSVLVELLRREQRSPLRRIRQVVTFNADDLLERSANRDVDAGRAPVLFPVPRGSFHPRYRDGAFGQPPITVYHLHGFIPRSPTYSRRSEDTLVFTDAQYWGIVSEPSSFANRVMGTALQETRCIFVGISMTDANLMRWLGLHFNEFMRDRQSFYDYTAHPDADEKVRDALARHYWICTERSDPTRLIASHLERRGVVTVTVPSWGEPFARLMAECFEDPAEARTPTAADTPPAESTGRDTPHAS
jgi:SIR2-like domain